MSSSVQPQCQLSTCGCDPHRHSQCGRNHQEEVFPNPMYSSDSTVTRQTAETFPSTILTSASGWRCITLVVSTSQYRRGYSARREGNVGIVLRRHCIRQHEHSLFRRRSAGREQHGRLLISISPGTSLRREDFTSAVIPPSLPPHRLTSPPLLSHVLSV